MKDEDEIMNTEKNHTLELQNKDIKYVAKIIKSAII